MRIIIPFFLALVTCTNAIGQNQIQITGLDSSNISSVLSSTIFGGCVQISNISYAGSPSAFGLFTDADSTIGMSQGLVMSTGMAESLADSASNFASTGLLLAGDSDLDLLAGMATNDAAVLEFDFVPNSDTIFASQFVFGSEEYPEWVCSSFNDVFGFYVSGVTTSMPQTNVAIIPATTIPIAINTVNDDPTCGGDYSQFYVDNAAGTELVFDGHSTLIQLSQSVVPGETYHMKIAIADAGDNFLDSGVLLKSHTFCGNFWYQNPQFLTTSTGGLTYEFENQSYAAESYLWNFGDGTYSTDINPIHTYASPGIYPVTLTCSNSCQENEITVDLNAMVTGFEGDLSTANWSIGANSDRSLLTMKFEGNSAHQLRYRIIDIAGKVIYSQPIGTGKVFSKQIDISALNDGVYCLQLMDGDQTSTKKFIK